MALALPLLAGEASKTSLARQDFPQRFHAFMQLSEGARAPEDDRNADRLASSTSVKRVHASVTRLAKRPTGPRKKGPGVMEERPRMRRQMTGME